MKILNEIDYDRLSEEEKKRHHERIRKELIERGLLKPGKVDNDTQN